MKFKKPIPVDLDGFSLIFLGVEIKDHNLEVEYQIIDKGTPLPYNYEEQIEKFINERITELEQFMQV